MLITLFMDVEDIIAPESDDIAATCADILTSENVQATMCVVGYKARLLARRNRSDVIADLWRHDIGVHTYSHSVPPTVLEYLAPCGWEDGIAEAILKEAPGVLAIEETFGVRPSCWGGPGNTWGLQISAALRSLGVPALAYAQTCVPGGGPHRCEGILSYPQDYSLDDGAYHDEERAQRNLDRLVAALERDAEAGAGWRGVFIGHPTRILCQSFWDAENFGHGNCAPVDDWKPAPLKPKADLDRALAGFRTAVRSLRSIPGISTCTIREMNERLAPRPSRQLTSDEQASVWPGIESHLKSMSGWPILPPGFDLSSVISTMRAHLDSIETFAV
jgi:hypothetical protein